MSGGFFSYENQNFGDRMYGEWQDEELNALFNDLFCTETSVRSFGGLALVLDYWLSGDVTEETYREEANKFKAKWFGRTPKNRVDFYANKLQEQCDRMKKELTGALEIEGGR